MVSELTLYSIKPEPHNVFAVPVLIPTLGLLDRMLIEVRAINVKSRSDVDHRLPKTKAMR